MKQNSCSNMSKLLKQNVSIILNVLYGFI